MDCVAPAAENQVMLHYSAVSAVQTLHKAAAGGRGG